MMAWSPSSFQGYHHIFQALLGKKITCFDPDLCKVIWGHVEAISGHEYISVNNFW